MQQDFQEIMKQAQKMQEEMQTAQKELEAMLVVGSAGGGLIKIHMTGRHDVKQVEISDEILKEDKTMLQDLIAAAINDATRKIENETRGKMQKLTSGMNLPTDLGGEGKE